MAPSKHLGHAIGEVVGYWARQGGEDQVGAFWAAFGQVTMLDFEFASGEKSPEQVTRILQAWGVSASTAQLFVTERETIAA
jgi:hypothetical protein